MRDAEHLCRGERKALTAREASLRAMEDAPSAAAAQDTQEFAAVAPSGSSAGAPPVVQAQSRAPAARRGRRAWAQPPDAGGGRLSASDAPPSDAPAAAEIDALVGTLFGPGGRAPRAADDAARCRRRARRGAAAARGGHGGGARCASCRGGVGRARAMRASGCCARSTRSARARGSARWAIARAVRERAARRPRPPRRRSAARSTCTRPRLDDPRQHVLSRRRDGRAAARGRRCRRRAAAVVVVAAPAWQRDEREPRAARRARAASGPPDLATAASGRRRCAGTCSKSQPQPPTAVARRTHGATPSRACSASSSRSSSRSRPMLEEPLLRARCVGLLGGVCAHLSAGRDQRAQLSPLREPSSGDSHRYATLPCLTRAPARASACPWAWACALLFLFVFASHLTSRAGRKVPAGTGHLVMCPAAPCGKHGQARGGRRLRGDFYPRPLGRARRRQRAARGERRVGSDHELARCDVRRSAPIPHLLHHPDQSAVCSRLRRPAGARTRPWPTASATALRDRRAAHGRLDDVSETLR